MSDDVRVATACGGARGFDSAGTPCGHGICAPFERSDRPDEDSAREDSRRVRDERSDGTATLAEPRAKRRVRVEADRPGNDTNACGSNGREKASQKGKYPDAVGAGYRIQHKGRRRSEKAGASRLSDRQLRNMRKCEQRYARDLRKTATDAEKKFASFLKRTGIRYEFQKPVEIADRFYIVDFYLWEYATVIEIDGGYHETEAQRAKDDARTKDLSLKREYSRILRISNDEVMAMSDAEKRDWLAKNIFPWFFR